MTMLVLSVILVLTPIRTMMPRYMRPSPCCAQVAALQAEVVVLVNRPFFVFLSDTTYQV